MFVEFSNQEQAQTAKRGLTDFVWDARFPPLKAELVKPPRERGTQTSREPNLPVASDFSPHTPYHRQATVSTEPSRVLTPQPATPTLIAFPGAPPQIYAVPQLMTSQVHAPIHSPPISQPASKRPTQATPTKVTYSPSLRAVTPTPAPPASSQRTRTPTEPPRGPHAPRAPQPPTPTPKRPLPATQSKIGPPSEPVAPNRTLYVGRIPTEFTKTNLLTIFNSFGEVEEIRMLNDPKRKFRG